MTGRTTAGFWARFDKLPREVQRVAREKYALWRRNPFHPSLHFKQIMADLWSVRVSIQYRALGRRRGETIVWFWIGPHEEYDRLIGHQ